MSESSSYGLGKGQEVKLAASVDNGRMQGIEQAAKATRITYRTFPVQINNCYLATNPKGFDDVFRNPIIKYSQVSYELGLEEHAETVLFFPSGGTLTSSPTTETRIWVDETESDTTHTIRLSGFYATACDLSDPKKPYVEKLEITDARIATYREHQPVHVLHALGTVIHIRE